jgi:hypothetical protein
LLGAENDFEIEISNRGVHAETFNLELLQGEKVIASREMTLNRGDANEKITLSVKMEDVPDFELITLTARVVLPVDNHPDDNSRTLLIHSGNTFATESMTVEDITDGLGSVTSTISLGNIYTLRVADQLTSITALFRNEPNSVGSMGIAVYKVGNKGADTGGDVVYILGEEIYSATVSRPLGGLVTWDLSHPLDLEPGTYYIEARQLNNQSIAIAYDKSTTGRFYLHYEEDGEQYITEVPYSSSLPIGNVALRANFAPHNPVNIPVVQNIEVHIYVADALLYVNNNQPIDQVTIYNIHGSAVYKSANGLNVNNYSVSIGGWAKGVYIARIATISGVKSVKFIVK